MSRKEQFVSTDWPQITPPIFPNILILILKRRQIGNPQVKSCWQLNLKRLSKLMKDGGPFENFLHNILLCQRSIQQITETRVCFDRKATAANCIYLTYYIIIVS